MLDDFKTTYDLHRWVRYCTWAILIAVTLLLVWAEKGFPPLVWFVFAQAVQRFPHAWATQGVAAIFSIVMLGVLSLLWLLSWGLLLWITVVLLRPRKHDARHVAWRESRTRNIHIVRSLNEETGEDTSQEDPVNIPKLRLPHRSQPPLPEQQNTKPSRPSHPPQESPRQQDVPRPPQRPPNDGPQWPQDRAEPTRRFASVTRPVLVAVGQSQRTTLPSTPRPEYNWKREPQNSRAIEDVPTTPERGPHADAPIAMLTRTRTRLEVGVGWNSGITRQQQPNEDSLIVLQGTCTYNDRLVPFGLFVVADGMGGHDFGQEASRMAMHCMMQTVLRDIVASDSLNDTIIIDLLVSGVEEANTAICNRCREWGRDMGTTITAALVVGTKAYVVNVGDSRTYLYDDMNGLTQITLDHSLVANLVMAGVITPEEVYTHPERNKVYRSLGNRDGVEVDWFTRDLRKGDRLLLCSDGLWEMVRPADMRRMVGSNQEPTQICDQLVQAALRGGGADNVSVIVVKVG